VASAQTLTFLDAQGGALTKPYFEGSRAYLRVVDPGASTSVQVNVSAAMSFDQETLALAETGPGSGVFQGSIALSNAAPQPDGVLETSRNVNFYPWTFDTLTATYGAATVSAAMVGSTVTATNAGGTPVTTYVIGDRIYIRVADALADTTSGVDTTTVNLLSSVGFIGEYEPVSLTETGATTAVFEGSIPMVQSSDPVTHDGTVEVIPGSSLRIEHADANGQTYSVIEALRVLGSQPPSIAWVDDYDQPLSLVYEFSYPRLKATDGAAAGQGYLNIQMSSVLAGDQESASLWEDTLNPGVFYGGMTIWPQAYGFPPSSNGRLDVTVNPGPPVQRDTAVARLECATPPCATASAGVVGSTVRFTDDQRADVSFAFIGTVVYVEGVDFYVGQSRLATVTSSSGDSETIYLNQLLSGPYQTPVYGHRSGIVPLQPGPVVQEDSLLQVSAGDTVTVTYPDPSGYGSSTDTVTVVGQQVEFLNRAGNPVSSILANGPVRLRVTYPAGNTSPGTADILTLNVLSWDSFSNVFDTEAVSLFETGPATGVFTGEIQSRMGSASGPNGILETSNYYPEYDRIEVTLGSASFPANILPGIVRFVDASGVDVTEVTPGANLYAQEEVESPYWSPSFPDTVYLSFRNLTTNDEEFAALTETGPDTRVFQGFIPTALAANAVRYDGALQVRPGETIQANAGGSYGTFTDEVVAVQGGLTNLPPVASFDTFTTNDNQSTTFSVTANDTDPESQPITLVSVTQGVLGSVSIVDAAQGTILYTPSGLYSGSDSFTYTITDSQGATATGTCTVEVLHVNRPPVAVNDTVTLAEDTAAFFDVVLNDSDPDGDTLVVSGATAGAHGQLAVVYPSYLYYQPAVNYYGTDTVTYTVADGHGGTATATVNVTITPVNDPPVAVADSRSAPEDTAITINVLTNDSDIDGDTLAITAVTQGAHGRVAFTSTNVTYTPVANYNGADSFTYTVSDGHGGTASATVSMTVSAVNDPPAAAGDSATTPEDTAKTINVLINDSDIDGDTLTVTGVTQATHGTVTFTTTSVTYTPAANYNGADSFTYTISDGHGGSATATVSMTVTGVNDSPVAVADSASTPEDTAATINVLANDSDIDGDTLTVSAVTQGTHGTVAFTASNVTYTPAANYNGADSFTYSISDGQGGTASATVVMTVSAVNDPPTAAGDSATTPEDTAATINVLTNDSDIDGDTLAISAVTQGTRGTVAFTASNVTYTPAANYNGADSFTYTIGDGHGGSAIATVSMTVSAVNDVPTAVGDSASTPEDTAVTINVLANDSDIDGDTMTVTGVTQGTHGTVAFTASNVTYTPAASYNGADSFIYTIGDGHGGSATATVSMTVSAVNDPPTAAGDSATTPEDTAATINVLANDSDIDGDTLTVSAVTQGTHGTVAFTASNVTYTPAANYNGADSFTYTIGDGQGGSATATVSMAVSAVNDAPVATGDSATTPEDTAKTINVLTNDSDIDGDTLTVSAVTQGTHGTVAFTASNVTYTPAANYNGADSFTYTVGDGHGGTATATVSMTVSAVNDSPVAASDSPTTPEDTAATINVLTNDSDVDGDTLTVTGVTQGAHGTVAFTGTNATYMPAANYNGGDSFTYTISDGHGGSATASVSMTVAAVNDPPVAGNDSATVNEGSSVIITVLGNDTDIEGNVLTVTTVSSPAHGTATRNADNTITYAPSATYSGADSFTYTVSDGAATATATVTVTVKDLVKNVALLGTHSIWIQTGADVLSGDVIVNAAGSAPFLSSTELSLASGVTTASGWDVEANRVTVASTAVVASDVYSNQLFNSGTVSGAQYSPLSLPVFATLPTLQTGTPNSTDVSVATNGTRTLAPGTYRDLIVGKKGTVTFSGGVYVFRSLQLSSEAKLFFSAASTVVVQQKVSASNLVQIKPGTGSTATAATIVFHIAGVNGTGGGLAETPKAVEIGTDSTISANFYVPNGMLWLKDRTVATGAFIARDIQANPDVQVTLSSAW